MIYGKKLPVIEKYKDVNWFNYSSIKHILEDSITQDDSDKEITKILAHMVHTVSYSARMGIKMKELYDNNYQYQNHMARLVKEYISYLDEKQIKMIYDMAKEAFVPKTINIKFIPVGIPSIDNMEKVINATSYIGKKLNIDEYSQGYYKNIYKKIAVDLSKVMIITKRME